MSEPTTRLLEEELRALRKGRGLSLARLRDQPTLLQVLGTSTLGDAEQKLIDTLDGLGTGIIFEALRNALAIGMADPGTLTSRRADFSLKHNKHTDTLEVYENEAIRELAVKLVAPIAF